jgi:DNA-binding transcriptional LysR family regulator
MLERHLGSRLLTRTTRSVALTDDGEQYFEQARRLVAEITEAEEHLRRGEQQLSGWLRVAASTGFGLRVMMPHVRQFMIEHPGVKIDLRLNDDFVDLVEQGIDIAVRIGHLRDSNLIARRVGSSMAVAVASRTYLKGLPKVVKPPRLPADLLAHPCIVYTELSTKNVWRFARAGGSGASVAVEGRFKTNNSEAVRDAVLGGMGIACAPTWMFQRELASQDVRTLLPDWAVSPLPVNLVYPAHRRHAAKVRAFSEYFARALAE